MREVGKRERKKDAIALVTGQPVYVDDLAPKECLVVKLLRSPHANAIVEDVNSGMLVYPYHTYGDGICIRFLSET